MLKGGLNGSGSGTTQHDDAELGGVDTLVGDEACTTGSHRPVRLDRGSVLGRYMLLERVGSGGMGVVYAAYDPELDRRIALKVLKGDAYGDSMPSRGPSRLLREAQAMAKLSHANVVTVHDVGTLGREVFIAMEFIEGLSLRAWLSVRHRTPTEVIEVFAQAGRGLAAAHNAGLIHRDFKPDNVLVADNGRVVVTDFGLARRKTPEDATTQSNHPSASATARVIRSLEDAVRTAGNAGTPAYMAPEQHTKSEITEAADQFSFCVALYEALCDQHPFRGSDPVSLSTSVVDDVRRPNSLEVRRVPWRIRRAIERGLCNDPDRRWPSMRPLLAQLGPGPVAARRKWIGIGVGGSVVAGSLALLASDTPALACRGADRHFDEIWDDARRADVSTAFKLTSIEYAGTAYRKAAHRLDAYAEGWVEMRTEACEATAHGEQSEELLDRRMHCLDGRREAFEQLLDVFAKADDDVVMHAAQAALDLPPIGPCASVDSLQASYPTPSPEQRLGVDEARKLRARAEALRSAGKFRDGLVVAADAMRKAEATEYAPEIAWARHSLSSAHAELGNLEIAEELATQALVEAREANDPDLEASAWLRRLEIASKDPRRHGEARRWLPLAQSAVHRTGDAVAHASALARLEGTLAAAAGDYALAAGRMEYALELAMEAHGPESPQVATTTSTLAVVLTHGRLYQRAREICDSAFDRLGRAFGPQHPELLEPSRACADLERRMGNFEGAQELYARAHVIAVETYGPRHESVARAMLGLSTLSVDRREFKRAEGLQRDALSIATHTLGENDALTAEIRAHLAGSLRASGRLLEARQHAERAVEVVKAALGHDHPKFAGALAQLARVNAAEGDLDLAESQLRLAVTILPETSPAASAFAGALAEVMLEQERPTAALELLSKVVAGVAATPVAPTHRATLLFLYAQAVHRSGGSPSRATAIANEARGLLLTRAEEAAAQRQEIDAWLAARD